MGTEKSLNFMQPAAITVITLAMIVLMGIAFVDQFGFALRDNTDDNINSLNVSVNGTAVLVGTSGQFPFLQTLTGCVESSNASQSLAESNYTVDPGNELGGFLELTPAGFNWSNRLVNCNLTYLADGDGQAATDNFIAGLAIFGTFMAVIVLALIGIIIVGLFRKKDE